MDTYVYLNGQLHCWMVVYCFAEKVKLELTFFLQMVIHYFV